MAKVPSLPSNGQPIDTQYIYDIVNSLININSELASYGSANVTYKSKQYGVSNTNSLNFDAQTIPIMNSEDATPGVSRSGQAAFSTSFTNIPIVTATIVSTTASAVVATVTITAVDTTTVYYKVDFVGGAKGKASLDLNIIAIGV
jgi:hypothetical protein